MQGFDPADELLARAEQAGLNASATPDECRLDGWLIRRNPGKAKRSRCVNAVGAGVLPLPERLAAARALFAEAGLPFIVRITPFSQPADLDKRLAAAGYRRFDEARVMLRRTLQALPSSAVPDGSRLVPLSISDFAECVGALRGTPPAQRSAHAERLRQAPVRHQGYALQQGGQTLACGQMVVEGPFVGLFDVFTAAPYRRRGLARGLCATLLAAAQQQGAQHAYLQVESDNEPARAVYQALGFTEAYSYHYRTDDPATK